MSDFPPEPWELRGHLHASLFLVPMAAFPPGELDGLPPGWTMVRWGGSAVVGAAWVVYEPGGVLTYRELMATVLLRRGVRLVPHIVRIWVDSEASRDGGRALWSIPKELADFQLDNVRGQARFAARDVSGPIAVTGLSRGVRLPGRWPVSFPLVQTRDDAGRRSAQLSPVRARAGLSITRGRWIVETFGPLGFLSGRRPVVTLTLRDFRMMFGALPAAQNRSGTATRTSLVNGS